MVDAIECSGPMSAQCNCGYHGGGDSAGPRTPTTPAPPPPPLGAFGQQLVGGVVGVQNRGVAPPGVATSEWVVHVHGGPQL